MEDEFEATKDNKNLLLPKYEIFIIKLWICGLGWKRVEEEAEVLLEELGKDWIDILLWRKNSCDYRVKSYKEKKREKR